MGEPEQHGPGAQWVEGGGAGVTAETLPRHIRFVRVSPSELDDLKSSNSTLELALAGICAGCLVTVLATLWTVTIADPSTHAAFVAAVIVFLLGFLYFGLATLSCEVRWRRKIDALKRGVSE